MNGVTYSSKAYRQTSGRIGKKLAVILVGVLAFFLLQRLENSKVNYEKEKAEPVVIVAAAPPPSPAVGTPVATTVASPSPTPENLEYVIKLADDRVQNQLNRVLDDTEQKLKSLIVTGREADRPLIASLELFIKNVKTAVLDARYEARRKPFDNENKFVGYLSDRIHKAKEEAEKLLASERKKRADEIQTLRSGFSKDPSKFQTELKTKSTSDADFCTTFDDRVKVQTPVAGKPTTQPKPDKPSAQPKPDSSPTLSLSTDDLAKIANEIDEERYVENHRVIDEAAYRAIDGLHSRFVPGFLTAYIKEQKEQSPHPSSLSEMVLDERRGGHVIYQIFYLALLGVLVFGVLAPIYFLLQALPPFAGSVEPLTERAKDLISSRRSLVTTSAAPEIVKSIALSVAAVGIGTAVVIANNPVTNPKTPSDEIAIAVDPDNPYVRHPVVRGPTPPPGFTPSPAPGPSPDSSPQPDESPSPTPSPGPTQTPSPPYQTPGVTHTFQLDAVQIARLDDGLSKLGDRLGTVEKRMETEPPKATAEALRTMEASLRPRLDDVFTRTAGFRQGDADKLNREVGGLTQAVSDIRTTDIPKVRDDLSTRLAATNTALTAFREGTQGPSIMSRARELLGREEYEVTEKSYEILSQLICRDPCTPAEAEILPKLKTLIRRGRMGKDTFRQRLGIRPSRSVAPSRWEALILRYTRVHY